MEDLEFSRTIPRGLVHRQSVADVFVTAMARRGDGRYDIGIQLPRSHAFYGERGASYDVVAFVEACRQACLVVAHRSCGVPIGARFLLRELTVTVHEPSALVIGDAPCNAALHCRTVRRFTHNGALVGLRLRHCVEIAGCHVMTTEFDFSWLSERTWARMRAGKATTGIPVVPRCDADTVGRLNPRNVVIGPLRPGDGGSTSAAVVVDTSHPTLFDHPVDHLPAMLQVEVFRQIALASAYRGTGQRAVVTAMRCKFHNFAELDLATDCRCLLDETAPEADGWCWLRQGDRVVAECELRLTYPDVPADMPVSSAEVDRVLTTTRTARRRIDLSRPVPRSLIEECLRIAVHAPTGGNRQDWRFLVIDDPATRSLIAGYYRKASKAYLHGQSADVASARFLAENLQHVPYLLVACIRGRVRPDEHPARLAGFYGSLYPAVWSFMLAARSRGLGTAFTTVHLAYERDIADLLGIPFDEVTQGALIPVGYANGDFAPARRQPSTECTFWNRWED